MKIKSTLALNFGVFLFLQSLAYRSLTVALKPVSPTVTASVTDIPPLIDVPTYSMATLNAANDNNQLSHTNMNILTYATPVSVRPDRVWAIGLYKDTLSYKNFCRERSCILQLLTEEHIPLIKLLGGSTGETVNKEEECRKVGLGWDRLPTDADKQQDSRLPLVLPSCAYYLKLTAIGELIDCGSHEVAICKVEEMLVGKEDESKKEYLSTARLRELGIITEQGRVAEY